MYSSVQSPDPSGLSPMLPEMAIGMIMEMVTGSELTPKGGLTELVNAHEKKMPAPAMKYEFGDGCYGNEPWSFRAVRKRVTALRTFYDLYLEGDPYKVR